MNEKETGQPEEPEEAQASQKAIRAHYYNTNSALLEPKGTFINWQGKTWVKAIALAVVLAFFWQDIGWAIPDIPLLRKHLRNPAYDLLPSHLVIPN